MTPRKNRTFRCEHCAAIREHEVQEDRGIAVCMSCYKTSQWPPLTPEERKWLELPEKPLDEKGD